MAGLIPQAFIDDLVGRADIVEIIDARVPLKKAGREYKACCPFHDEKTPSFTVSPSKQFYHCFGCGAHGTVLGFLMQYERMEFVDAVEELASRYGLTVPREGAGAAPDDAARRRVEAALDALDRANAWFKRQLREHPNAEAAKSYLKRRGMSGRTAAAFEIGYAPPGWDNLAGSLGRDDTARAALADAGLIGERDGGGGYDRFRDRITFPIHDRRGRVVGFGARTLGDDTPKYLNSPETLVFHKGRELYGLHRILRLRERPRQLVVVEGYMDVVMLAEHGVDYACAALGTAATPDQIERLFRTAADVAFCFDGDAAGRRAAWRALENALPFMRDGRTARFAFLPEGEDPDSFVRRQRRDGFEKVLADAPTLTEFLFRELRERSDVRSDEGRARLVEEARPLISRLPDGALKTLAAKRLSEVSQLPLERTEAHLGMLRPGAPAAPARAPAATKSSPGVVTPARRAITLLLHHPALAAQAGDVTDLALLDVPGAALLAELVATLKPAPERTTGWIVEHFRDHPWGAALERLAGTEAPPLGDALGEEFRDCLERVRRESGEARFHDLRERVAAGHANESERREYAALAQARGRRPG